MPQGITRRRFLIGAGAAATVAAGGTGAVVASNSHGVRRFLHSHGVLGGPDQAIPNVDAKVEYGELHSAAVHDPAGFGLYLPKGEVEAALLCLHGRGGSHRDPFEVLGVHRFVAAAGLRWAVAAVDGRESFWH